MSSAVGAAGDPIPTSAAKHIQFRCQEENVTRIRRSVSTKSSGHSLRPQLAERMSDGFPLPKKSVTSEPPLSPAEDEDRNQPPNRASYFGFFFSTGKCTKEMDVAGIQFWV